MALLALFCFALVIGIVVLVSRRTPVKRCRFCGKDRLQDLGTVDDSRLLLCKDCGGDNWEKV